MYFEDTFYLIIDVNVNYNLTLFMFYLHKLKVNEGMAVKYYVNNIKNMITCTGSCCIIG